MEQKRAKVQYVGLRMRPQKGLKKGKELKDNSKYSSMDVLKELDVINKEHTTHCGNLCRHAVYATFSGAWGLFVVNNDKVNTWFCITMFAAIFYVAFEAISNYWIAKEARRLHNEIFENEKSEGDGIEEMNYTSDKSFIFLKYKIIWTFIVIICLMKYVYELYLIRE